MTSQLTAGELSKKAFSDNTKYEAREVGLAITEKDDDHAREAIENYKPIYDEEEFCVVLVNASDPLIKNLIRRKWYCWLYLPKPRPDQAVFLYNKRLDRITKRLWVLPNALRMSQLASDASAVVEKEHELMRAWSVSFYQGTFWEFIRWQHKIDMLSEHEYFLKHRDELIKAGCKIPDASFSEPFDFDKISTKQIINPQDAIGDEYALCGLGKVQNAYRRI